MCDGGLTIVGIFQQAYYGHNACGARKMDHADFDWKKILIFGGRVRHIINIERSAVSVIYLIFH